MEDGWGRGMENGWEVEERKIGGRLRNGRSVGAGSKEDG